eukprot:477127-Heterocapsa_arctica.AAC.1
MQCPGCCEFTPYGCSDLSADDERQECPFGPSGECPSVHDLRDPGVGDSFERFALVPEDDCLCLVVGEPGSIVGFSAPSFGPAFPPREVCALRLAGGRDSGPEVDFEIGQGRGWRGRGGCARSQGFTRHGAVDGRRVRGPRSGRGSTQGFVRHGAFDEHRVR